MRQSEVSQILKKYGHERGTLHVMMRLAEEITDTQRAVTDMAQTIAAMSNVIGMLSDVADGMKTRVDDMGKHFSDDSRSTYAIARGGDKDGTD